MKKTFFWLTLPFLALSSCSDHAPSSSNSEEKEEPLAPRGILNGGFEASSLEGWEILWGNAYDDDSVSSSSFFRFSYDEKHQEISRGKEGNWYLDGRGFDGTRRGDRTGAIRSSTFVMGSSGDLSFRLAGGALVTGRGSTAKKPEEKRCYLGVYDAETDELIAKQYNDYFVEQTDPYVSADKYEAGVYSTDNFASYSLSLLDYVGKELYLQIVDNDPSFYYGYLSVDDIRVDLEDPQPLGPSYVKTPIYSEDVEAPSIYEIKNGGFETGSLAGWEVLEGEAFSNDGVNAESTWWNENISYSRDGSYHYGHYRPEATGRMRSSSFLLGGSGFVSFKLGGGMHQDLCYLSFVLEGENGSKEVARFANSKYWNFQFPYVENGMRLLNMNLYVAELSLELGRTLHIEVVDLDASSDELSALTLDSIQTYYEKKPEFYAENYFQAKNSIPLEEYADSPYQVLNGGFETGDLTGWEFSSEGEAPGEVLEASLWWGKHAYNNKGRYLYSGEKRESGKGKLRSSPFLLSGTGHITYLLGGAKDPRKVYLSLLDVETGEELGRYGNPYFNDLGEGAINKGSNLMNLLPYDLDASSFLGRRLCVELVDSSSSDWGLMAFDSLCTYHPSLVSIPEGSYSAKNLLSPVRGEGDDFEIRNGDFETGDLTGWKKEGGIGEVDSSSVYWQEFYSFEKEGSYFFSGWKGDERLSGSLLSSPFQVNETARLTFRLGGMKNADQCYLSLVDEESGEEVARYGNPRFNDSLRYRYSFPGCGKENVLSKEGEYMANLAPYVADLSAFKGRVLRVKLVDNASRDWGLFFADDFRSHYETLEEINASYFPAINLLA